jgi:hypothetical protein
MGLQATIDISYSKDIDIKSFIETLFSIGWGTNDNGKITYLTNDDFDWESDELDNQELIIKLLFERFLNNKIIGIAFTLPNLTGGLFHFLPGKNEVMILLNINRVTLKKIEFTDYTFYLNNLYPVIKECIKLNYCDIV